MARTGKGSENIFAPTTVAKAASGKGTAPARGDTTRPRGRPVSHEEPTTKATVVLYNRQIARLDRLAAEIRERSGNVVNRADIIRAVLEAVEDSKLDLTGATSAEDVRRLVLGKLKR